MRIRTVLSAIALFYLVFLIRTFVYRIYPSPPFYFDEKDSLMDYVNTCFWTLRDDKYTTWRSLYLPFSHFLCKMLNILTGDPTESLFRFRDYGKVPLVIFSTYIVQFVLMVKLAKASLEQKRTIVVPVLAMLSVPILFAFERGNVLIFGLLLVSIVYMSSRYRINAFLAALAVSIKPYIVLFILPVLKRKQVPLMASLVLIIQVISYVAIKPQGIEFIQSNLKYFANFSSIHDLASYSFQGFSLGNYEVVRELAAYGIRDQRILILLDLATWLLYSVGVLVFVSFLSRCFILSRLIVKERRSLLPIFLAFCASAIFSTVSAKSGAYAVSFLILTVVAIEGRTRTIQSSPITMLMFFLGLCLFDIPAIDAFNSYACRESVLLQVYLGQMTCHSKVFGVVTLLRPVLLQLFLLSFSCRLRVNKKRAMEPIH